MSGLLNTKSYNIKDSVFDGETEAIMYITKDIYLDAYIVAIPVITFSWGIIDERDYDYLLNSTNIFGDKDKQERLVKVIKQAVLEFESI